MKAEFGEVERVIMGVQINNMVKNPDLYYKKKASAEQIKTLATFLNERGIGVPDITANNQLSDDIKITMYRAWHSITTLEAMCKLIGEQAENKVVGPVSRFDDLLE